MSARWLVSGYSWGEGVPSLRLRPWDGQGPVRTLPLGAGELLDLGLTRLRGCVGRFEAARQERCPDRAELGEGEGGQCARCLEEDTFRPCMTCDGFRCPRLVPEMRARCRSTHHLYLACFGDRALKVGTTADHRRVARLVEQGPLAAARVGAGEGPRIRQAETMLVRAGFVGLMRRSRKESLLASGVAREEAEAWVREAVETLPRLLPETHHDLLHPPEWIEMPAMAVRARELVAQPMPIQPGTVLRGEVVAGIGHLLLVRDGDGVFSVDLGALRARVVELAPVGAQRRPVVQLGLF